MQKMAFFLLILFIPSFFYVTKAFAGTCDTPSVCNTNYGLNNDKDPQPGTACDIPNVTSPGQYVFGSTTVCPFFNISSTGIKVGVFGNCVPKCGFLSSGFCCDVAKGQHPVSPTPSVPPPPPCAKKSSNGGCASVNTGIGTLETDINSLTGTIFKILLSLSGGVAVLLIIAAGYQMAISQGNPEKVKEARERLIAAIVGLLFIILSVAILQIIGVDILRLPGFGK